MSTALRSVGFLDVLSRMPADSFHGAPCSHARLRRLATKPGEKCGLNLGAGGAFTCRLAHPQHSGCDAAAPDVAHHHLDDLSLGLERDCDRHVGPGLERLPECFLSQLQVRRLPLLPEIFPFGVAVKHDGIQPGDVAVVERF